MISKKLIGMSLGIALLLGTAGFAGYYFVQTEQEKSQENTDPLTALLGQDLQKNPENALKADFFTDTIYSYDGPISDKLQGCIDGRLKIKERAMNVFAPYNPDHGITSTPEEILADINPVLGHAVRNQQINWEWNGDTKQYTFFSNPKDTKLWWCYFREDSEFFQKFLKKDEVHTGFKNIVQIQYFPPNTSIEELHRISSQEFFKLNIPTDPSEDLLTSDFTTQKIKYTREEAVRLGYIKIDTSEGLYIPDFFQNLLPQSSVSTDNQGNETIVINAPVNSSSTSEIRDIHIDNFLVNSFSSQEIGRMNNDYLLLEPRGGVLQINAMIGDTDIDPEKEFTLDLSHLIPDKDKILSPETRSMTFTFSKKDETICGKTDDPLIIQIEGETKTFTSPQEMHNQDISYQFYHEGACGEPVCGKVIDPMFKLLEEEKTFLSSKALENNTDYEFLHTGKCEKDENSQIIINYNPVADSTLEVVTYGAEIANLKISADSEEDVWVKTLTVELQGVDDGDFANLFIEVDGVVVSDVVASATSDDVTFDLTHTDARGVLIEDSSNEYFSVKADITSQIDSFDNNNGVKINDISSDIVAIGARDGMNVTKTLIGEFTPITFEGGDFELTLEGETGDIAADKDDVVLGMLTIENFGGEAEIQNSFKLNIVAGEGTGTNTSAAIGHIEDVTLVDTVTGQIVFGPKTPNAGGDVLFNDTLVVAATSKLVLEVQADINENAEDGETFKVQYTINSADVEGGPDLDDATAVDLKPSAGVIDANDKTVSLPAVEFAGKSLGSDNVVESATDVVVWEGTVRANDVEDIKVTRVGFKNDVAATATTSDVNDYDLYAIVDGEEVSLETSVSSAAAGTTFTFSSLKDGGLTVGKGEEITLELKANIAATVTPTHTVQIALTQADVQAKDEDGDFLTTFNGFTGGVISSGATYTLVNS